MYLCTACGMLTTAVGVAQPDTYIADIICSTHLDNTAAKIVLAVMDIAAPSR